MQYDNYYEMGTEPQTVYCPMCEIIHVNNSSCQRND